jgi:hypothetical protein
VCALVSVSVCMCLGLGLGMGMDLWYSARTYHIIQQNGNQKDRRILLLDTISAFGIPPICAGVRPCPGTGGSLELGITGCSGLLLTMYPAVDSSS